MATVLSRLRGVANMLKMGHCAPSVMQASLDAAGDRREWLVKLVAGLPGGIGNTGFECGGVTSPLVMLGLERGLHDTDDGLPVLLEQGHLYCQRFHACHGTLLCREIRRDARVPLRCIGVVHRSPGLLETTRLTDPGSAIPASARKAYARVLEHFENERFHCAHAVFARLGDVMTVDEQLLDGTAAFMCGTLLKGMTCSALTAGIMAVGLRTAEIEDSYLRVMRMIALMAVGGDAFADHVNKFSRTMNTGNRIAEWFAREFGGTQCRAITGCDFSTEEGARQYADQRLIERCRRLAEAVAERVREVVKKGGGA